MLRYLLTFHRQRAVRFLSHLEETRALERTLRRANIPLLYSQGFSPRPLISFGPPLPVGFSSRAQLLEIKLETQIKPEDILCKVNSTLPEGYFLSEVKRLNENYPSLGSFPLEINYLLLVEGRGVKLSVSSFLNQYYYQVFRKDDKKKKEKSFNIRPFVLKLAVINWGELSDFLKTMNPSCNATDYLGFDYPDGTWLYLQSLYTNEGSVKINELEKALNVKIIYGERISIARHH